MKPTVIKGSDEPKTVKPTVIATPAPPTTEQPARQPLRPTTMSTPARSSSDGSLSANPTVIQTKDLREESNPAHVAPRPTAMSAAMNTVQTVPVAQATAVPGSKRERISVTLSDLEQLGCTSTPHVLEQALQLVLVTNIDAMTMRTAVLWGQPLQERYSVHVSASLELAQADALSRATTHVGRILDILGSIDLKKVCSIDASEGLLTRLIGKATKRIDTPSELSEAQVELAQIVALLRHDIDRLFLLKDRFECASRDIDELGTEVEAAAIAAAFIADYVRIHQPQGGLHERFSDRSTSLTETLAQIRTSGSMREIQIEQPLRLISTVQHVALVALPSWLSSIASLKTMLEGKRKINVTQVGELSNQLAGIIRQMKGDRA